MSSSLISQIVQIGFVIVTPTLGVANDQASEAPRASIHDLDAVRAAHVAAQHRVIAKEDFHVAHNPGQDWSTGFDGRGFLTTPRAADWTWGLELIAYGFQGAEHELAQPAGNQSIGNRFEYLWDSKLTEWYINDQRGLEHGFTLLERPEQNTLNGQSTDLRLVFEVRGELAPQVATDARNVSFVSAGGTKVLTYSNLTVFDSDGKICPARFEVQESQLVLSVEECDANYPLTIDPIAQQAYLKPSNTDAGDSFGFSVAASGDTLVVGAPYESSSATGVNGDQMNNGKPASGAAYVFVRNGSVWTQQAYLKASVSNSSDLFGWSVAIDGETIVVGTPGEDSIAVGVNGDETDNSAYGAGAAHVFVRNGTTWTQQAYLKASNTESLPAGQNDEFGFALAISGDTIVVAAPSEDSGSAGVNGDHLDNSASRAGAAYVFSRTGTVWTPQAYIKSSNPDSHDRFGTSLGVDGDLLAIGAFSESSPAAGIDGDESDNSGSGVGAVYAFARTGTNWSQVAYIKSASPDNGDHFGKSVAVTGNTVVVGAPNEDGSSTGVNGDEDDDTLGNAGAVFVFVRDGTSWSQEAYLKASNPDLLDWFGSAVAASGDQVLVGVSAEESSATGANGNQNDNSLERAGAAYLFQRNSNGWGQSAYLKASNTGFNDEFGKAVGISNGTAIVGAPREQSNATGIDGSESDNSLENAGAAYAIDVSPAGPSGDPACAGDGTGNTCPCLAGAAGEGCANSTSQGALLVGTGTPSFSSDTFGLSVSGLPPNKIGLCLKGSNLLGGGDGNPIGDGLLCMGGEKRSQAMVASATGTIAMTNWRGQPFGAYLGVANPTGQTYYQWWYRDPGFICSGLGFNFSNGWSVAWE